MPGQIWEVLRSLRSGGDRGAALLGVVTGLVAVGMAVLHMLQAALFPFPSGQFKNLHVGLATLLVLLGTLQKTPRDARGKRLALGLLAVLALLPLAYIHVEHEALTETRQLFPNAADTWVALLLLALATYATAREWGLVIPALALGSLFYGYFGYLLPGELFFHGGITFQRLIGYTSIPYFRGLLGALTEISAGTIFLFMLFAGVLQATGGIELLIRLAYGVGGRTRAGPAQVAVVGSGLMGMISGSTVANVATTGAFTIPMMKRFGFKPEFAGAVEAVASTGGQIMPPVMGVAAFLIVGITGIPYTQVAASAIFPALIYYLYLMVAVHIRAAKMGLNAAMRRDEPGAVPLAGMSLGRACLEHAHLLAAIAVLVHFLVLQMPAGLAALYSTLTLMGLDAVKRAVRLRRTPAAGACEVARVLVDGLRRGARSGAQVAIVTAVINILVEVFVVTGFAQKLSHLMLELSGGSLPVLLILAAVTCLAFGTGMPTSAAYILVALLGAPALTSLGVPVLAAHMFVFYFANVSSLTPPVAVGALVGANMAGADFWKTAMLSVWLGLPGFLLPFQFVARPEILGLGAGFLTQLVVSAIALLGVIALNLALEGYCLSRLAWWERLLLLPAAAGLLDPGWWTTVAGLAIFAGVFSRQVVRLRIARPARAAADLGGP